MKNIEARISPLIENMFPAFYKDDGPDFIAFIKAYYEWLEQNHQLLTLDDADNFNVGDRVTQLEVTGEIIAKEGNDILVYVDGLETFKCFTVCSSLDPITSSSGGSSYITRGGTTRRLGSLFLSRNLLNIQDIDTTIDLFISHFKEKYLKNIEFDTESNKRLLIKHSLDLYRSKGTERSIDLFFRLIYGVNTQVYYPGDDLFRLSSAQWTKPIYLEISESSETRAISLVGKQIKGVTSGATAFVEKYIKRKVKNGSVHILYLSDSVGNFQNRELLISDKIYRDSPTVLGSLNQVEIVTGGKLFEVGDIVSFNSVNGDYGLARVSEVNNKSGVVDFLLIDGGWGYTDSANAAYTENDLRSRTQSIISEKVLTLSNVNVTNSVATISITAGGTGYANADRVNVTSLYNNAYGVISTNTTGGITSVSVANAGSGFLTLNPSYTITNSTGGATTGSAATLVVTTAEQNSFFDYFEDFKQPMVTVTYDAATNSELFTIGSSVRIGNSSSNVAFGVVLDNGPTDSSNGSMVIWMSNNGSFSSGNTIYLSSNASVTANAYFANNTTAKGAIMGLPNAATIEFGELTGDPIVRSDEVYQVNTLGAETGNAIVSEAYSNSIIVSSLKGVFKPSRALLVRSKSTNTSVTNITLNLGVYNITGNYTNTLSTGVFSKSTGTTANLISISSGAAASFRVGTITDSETIFLNTDLLAANNTSNVAFMDLRLNTSAYGFPKNPSGNSSAILYSCLNYDLFTIGTIGSLTSINPGAEYNITPYVLAYQPYIAGFNRRDYIINVANTTGNFFNGELIAQANTTINNYDLTLVSATGFTLGEKVYQGTIGAETATGIVNEISTGTNTLTVSNTTGTFLASNTLTKSYISGGLSSNTTAVSLVQEIVTSKGIIKSGNTSVIKVKRTQFENKFVVGATITGRQSNTSAVIVNVSEDPDTLPIGLNAQIAANVVTANGTVAALEIIDSGLGYSNGEIGLFSSEDGLRSGEAKFVVKGAGHGSGYYKTTKGFLSSISKIHDGDYYQEYSYDIMSKIPLEKYSGMFKKVMHTAGTRFFGSILLEENELVDLNISSNTAFTNSSVITFNAQTNVASQAITANNTLVAGMKVLYNTSNILPLAPLVNNRNYYVFSANSSTIKLSTNPRAITGSFTADTIANNFLNISRHNFVTGDVVKYYTANGTNAIAGLSNNATYMISTANTSGVVLSYSNGTSITVSSNTTPGAHYLQITNIDIVATTQANSSQNYLTFSTTL